MGIEVTALKRNVFKLLGFVCFDANWIWMREDSELFLVAIV